jgi:hypothetical protein
MVLELAGSGPRPTTRPQAVTPEPARPAGWPIAWLLPVVLVGLIFRHAAGDRHHYFAAQSNLSLVAPAQ